jgi:Tol biopolymer transport system component
MISGIRRVERLAKAIATLGLGALVAVTVGNAERSGAGAVSVNHRDLLPSWSPSGRFIAFERDARRDGPRAIFKVRSTGGPATRITTGGEPDWSPDGRWIAIADHGDIYVVHGDGSGRRLAIGGAPVDGKPRWSPDGTKIGFVRLSNPGCAAFNCLHDLWVADRTGRNQRRVVRRADLIDW